MPQPTMLHAKPVPCVVLGNLFGVKCVVGPFSDGELASSYAEKHHGAVCNMNFGGYEIVPKHPNWCVVLGAGGMQGVVGPFGSAYAAYAAMEGEDVFGVAEFKSIDSV